MPYFKPRIGKFLAILLISCLIMLCLLPRHARGYTLHEACKQGKLEADRKPGRLGALQCYLGRAPKQGQHVLARKAMMAMVRPHPPEAFFSQRLELREKVEKAHPATPSHRQVWPV